MKQVNAELVANNVRTMSIKPEMKTALTDNDIDLVNGIFKQFQSIFTSCDYIWKNTERLNDIKAVWVKAFQENGINRIEQIQIGLKACRSMNSAFMPTVGQFIEMCKLKPENLGLPSVDIAFNKALAGGLLHPVIDAAARETGKYDLARGCANDAQLKKRFEYYYTTMIERFARGEALHKPATKAIELKKEKRGCGIADDLLEREMKSVKGGYEEFKKIVKGVKQ